MGHIVKDNDKGIHGEARRESFVVYTDFGDQRIELDWKHLDELELLTRWLRAKRPGGTGISSQNKEGIEAMLKRIERDDRYRAGLWDPATIQINAPLALIQVEMKAQVRALKWVLGLDENIGTSAAE